MKIDCKLCGKYVAMEVSGRLTNTEPMSVNYSS